ncbi:hypothetical protein LLE87_38280, partial [Paenibacillus polymyxa]|nr:hypothetical protein [Paenibacillus polymyxa]
MTRCLALRCAQVCAVDVAPAAAALAAFVPSACHAPRVGVGAVQPFEVIRGYSAHGAPSWLSTD